jgi:glycerophosphoryl diester phosphodiesterase
MVIAHRTCPRDAPENSLAGIAMAAALAADGVEVDVRRTADGVPVLLHDRRLLRTTGRLATVAALPLAELRRVRLRGGGTIPTLAEALSMIGPTMKIAIDVKDPGAGPAVVEVVRAHGLEARVLFWSQHEEAVRACADRAPELEISLLRDTRTPDQLARFLADAERFGARGISAHWSQISPGLAETCSRRGLSLYAWCKRERIEADKLAVLRGVVTDWPAAARAAVAELEP